MLFRRKKLFRHVVVIGLYVILVAAMVLLLTQPSFTHYPPTSKKVDPYRLRTHVETLAIDLAPRNYLEPPNLDTAAGYIADHLTKAGGHVSEQRFKIHGNALSEERAKQITYRNIIASFGPESGERIVVGAHYDVCGETPGADDNASGVAGLIELAYLLGRSELQQRVDLVAYTLEEPPFFRTSDMGSARHASSLKQEGVAVEAMIGLEMIGCFKDEPGSQRFPTPLLKLLYPDRGNYIAVVGGFHDRRLIRQVKAVMRGATDLPAYALCAFRSFAGIDLSDHRNYWDNGYTAVMITDTSFYRNQNYHRITDTPDTLDYERMAKVVLGVYEVVGQLAKADD